MKEVKAEYQVGEDSKTGEEVHIKYIPPEPSNGDLGGISEEEIKKIEKNETLDVEVQQTDSRYSASYTFDEMMEAYSAGRDIRVRLNSDNYAGKEFTMHNVGNSETKIEFHSIMELSGKLIFLELECDNQDSWDLFSQQYIPADSFYDAVEDGAGAHNSLYRGKSLGSKITDEQLNRITDGTFRGLFVGDYWTISGVDYVIADFDYMYSVGDTELKKHHVLVVPRRPLYNLAMNSTNTTQGGYTGSSLYQSGLDTALTSFKNAFGESNVLQYRNLLVNATSGDNPTNWAWLTRQIDLMSETMVYGQGVWRKNAYDVGCQKRQLSLYRLRHDFISIGRTSFWLRDVNSSAFFSYANDTGYAGSRGASAVIGVLPFALIGKS